MVEYAIPVTKNVSIRKMVRPGFEPETSCEHCHMACETDVITNYTIEPVLLEIFTFCCLSDMATHP